MNPTLLFAFALTFIVVVVLLNKQISDAKDANSNYARAMFLLSEFRNAKWKSLDYMEVIAPIITAYIKRFKEGYDTKFGFEMALEESEIKEHMKNSTGAKYIVDALLQAK